MDEDRRDLILHKRERRIADEHGCSVADVNAVLDHHPIETNRDQYLRRPLALELNSRKPSDVRDLLKSLADKTPDLADIVSGRVAGRLNDEERVVFLNPVGTGLQFAAVAKQILSAAERQGIGERLPTIRFTEDMHP
jgi:hypothetical protein